jgi:hypothetical protein
MGRGKNFWTGKQSAFVVKTDNKIFFLAQFLLTFTKLVAYLHYMFSLNCSDMWSFEMQTLWDQCGFFLFRRKKMKKISDYSIKITSINKGI